MPYNLEYLGGPIYFGSKSSANMWWLDTADADPTTPGYVADGYRRGMTVGDLVIVRRWDNIVTRANLASVARYQVVAVAVNGGATLAAEAGAVSRLDTLDATDAPTVNDDTADGYRVGSMWVWPAARRIYHALDVTTGAAVWLPTRNSTVLTCFGVDLDADDGLGSFSWCVPWKFRIIGFKGVLRSATANGAITCTLAIGATPVTGASVVFPDAATAGTVVNSTAITGANTGGATNLINLAVSTTQTASCTGDFLVELIEEL